MLERVPQVLDFSDSDKLLLAQEIYAKVFPQTPEQEAATVELLREREREYQANPDDVRSWEEVKETLAEFKKFLTAKRAQTNGVGHAAQR